MTITAEQLEDRKTFVGGSDAPIVLGLSSYGVSRYELYLAKRGELAGEKEENEAMEWGNRLEESIAKAYAEKTGRKIERIPTMVHPDYPWMGVNMDYVIIGDPRGLGYLEIKNFGHWKGKDIRSIADIPEEVYVQVQHGLAFPEFAFGAVAILVGGQRLFYDDVERDQEFINFLVEQEKAFMEMVRDGNPPAVEAREVNEAALKRMYPADNGRVLDLSHPAILTIAQELVKYKELMDENEEKFEERKNAMKLLMKDSSEAVIDGFGRFTWKCSKVSSKSVLDEGKLQREFGEVYKACLKKVKTGGTRTFNIKPDRGEKEDAA